MKRLSEEIRRILDEAASGDGDHALDEDDPEQDDDEELCEDTGTPCWKLQETAQFVADELAEETGLDAEVLSAALTEAMKCDSKCGEKFRTAQGDFKGGKGTAFKTCEKYVKACCTGVKDASAFCAYLGRRAGKI